MIIMGLDNIRHLRTPFYHGTDCQNLPKIKADGLKVNNGSTPWAEEDWQETDEPKLTDRGIYMTKEFSSAVYFAWMRAGGSHDTYIGEDMCVVQVDCVPKDAQIGSDGWGEHMINKDIPAQCLTFFEPKDLVTKMNDAHIQSIADLGMYF